MSANQPRSYERRRELIREWLKTGKTGTASQIAAELSIDRTACYDSLRKLGLLGEAVRLRRVEVIGPTGRRWPDADLWGAAESSTDNLPDTVHASEQPSSIVGKALAARHPLQTIFWGAST